jgi:hypothetical protein
MGLSRREWLLGLPCVAAVVGACGRLGQVKPETQQSYVELLHTEGAARRHRVVVFMPDTEQTRQVWTGLSDELAEEVQLIGVQIEAKSAADLIHEAVHRHRPAALVLVNNPTVAAYREYQRSRPGEAHPPAVVVMTSLLEERELRLLNATGIRYEVPLVTAITGLRRLLTTPLERVAVIRRADFRGFVEAEAALARREKVRVVSEVLSSSYNASEIKLALRNAKQRADALWVLNDDRLLTEELLSQGWVVGLNERPWIPTIVGVSSLVSAHGSFGDVAFLPDHVALGSQTAEILFDAMQRGWRLENAELQLPVSTTSVLDLGRVRERFALREDALTQVDVILR